MLLTRPLLRLLATLLAVLGVLGALVVVGTGPAAAHSRLTTITPADGESVKSPPAKVVMTFNEDILKDFVVVRVSDGEGSVVASEDPVVAGPTVTQPLPEALPPGPYKVAYKVVSADSHPIAGSSSFTVVGDPLAPPPSSESPSPGQSTPAATSGSPGTAPPASASEPPSQEPLQVDAAGTVQDDGSGSTGYWIAGGVVLLMAVLTAALVIVRRRDAAGH